MIPNVTVNWCQRTAQCKWCPEHIEAGTPMVTVFFWMMGDDKKRKLNIKNYYHPQCWIDQALHYLNMNPYVPYIRKTKSDMSPEDRQKRLKIMRDKARLEQRKRDLKSTGQERVLLEARIDTRIAQLMVEISGVGGVPRKWLENL